MWRRSGDINTKAIAALLPWLVAAHINSAAALTLEPRHYSSLVDEGLTIFDPNTGLSWLKVNQSIDLSHDYVSSQLGVGGEFDGFRYASSAEVSALFTDAGIPNPYGIGPQNSDSPAYFLLIDMLGATLTFTETRGQGEYVLGITGTPGYLNADPGGPAYVLAMLNISASTTANGLCDCQNADASFSLILPSEYGPTIGSFLVATPIPAALPLFATGLVATGLLGWRRKRKSRAGVA